MGETVLHVLPTAVARGAQVYAGRLVQAMKGGPFEHELLTLFPDASARSFPGFDPRAWLRLRAAVNRYRPIVVVAHGGEPLKYAALTAGTGPLVYYKVGPSPQLLGPRRHLWRPFLRRAAGLAAVSDAMATELSRIAGVARSQVVVIPNGRDARDFQPRVEDRRPSGKPVIAFVGHLTAAKRPELFIAAVAELRRGGHDVDAFVAGDGPLRTALGPAAREAGVRLLGRRDDVAQLLAGSDLLVSTSEIEGLPGVLIEAGLSGVATVAADAGGVSEVIDHGRTGLVVPAGDGAALGKAMAELIADPDRRSAMGAAARTRCATLFGLSVSVDRWEQLLRSVLPPATASRT